METPLITIGFDKNGEADFGIRADITELSFMRMQELRAMIPVAIAQAEIVWTRSREKNDPSFQASSSSAH